MCRLPGWSPTALASLKVDTLTSGTNNLPAILASDTCQINDVPVMPQFDLLVMKIQGWWHHHISPRNLKDFQAKVKADIVDVDALLARAEEGVEYDDSDERAMCGHITYV